jgi:PA14 domain
VIVAWVAVSLSRRATSDVAGLNAEYIPGDAGAGEPVVKRIDADVSAAGVASVWRGFPPDRFRIRWFGYLTVGRAGTYIFATSSDDGSVLSIDGRTIVDNSGRHGTQTVTGRIALDAGPHFVLIEYTQLGGDYDMAWSWARDGEAPAPVQAWLLSPRRVTYARVLLAHWLDVGRTALGTLALLVGVWLVIRYPGRRFTQRILQQPADTGGRPGVLRIGTIGVASLVLFVALAILQTWPLASDPGHLSRNDNGDTMLNEWTLAWVAHQAPHDLLHLFDANNFHPERDTLAYSEAMIVQSALAAPLLWLGASPVLAYNIVLIAGFALSGWAMCLVIARWTGDWAAGLVSGILFGFNAHTLTRLPQMQALHPEFIPLMLLGLDTLLARPSARHAMRLAIWFALQALTSVYLLVIMAFAMAAGALARPEDWLGRRFRQVVPAVATAAALAAVLLAPFILPYWRVYHGQGMTRSIEEASLYAASWQDYLSTPSRVHYGWLSYRWPFSTALFPGFTGLALAALALARGAARDTRVRMCVAIGVTGVLLSFGGKLPGYTLLYNAIPLLHSIRVPSRFGYLFIVAVSAVAGFGVAELRRLTPAPSWKVVAAAVALLVTVEPLSAPIFLKRFDGVPLIYDRLRSEPDAVAVELPFPDPRSVFVNAKYMLNSTRNWRPLLNGYSGFLPFSYRQHFEELGGFPDPKSIAALARLGVTHVFVHLEAFDAPLGDQLDRTPPLRRVATDGSIVLYAIDRRSLDRRLAP